MPPKSAAKSAKKEAPKKKPMRPKEGGGKAKKKKWSKGKVRDKLNNMVLFDKPTYEKLLKEVPQYKVITPSVVCERLKIRASLARHALAELHRIGMRINVDTLVETNRLYLVPYCKFHVTQYHQWMLSESLRQATCSEQLSLEEEHEAQRLWQELDDRLTFIVLNKATILSSGNNGNLCETYVVPEDVEVKAMIGDVNMFITDYDGSDTLCARALHINLGDYTPKDNETYFEAEVSVMIADESVRGRGLAAEALAGMLEFASKHLLLKPYSLVAKVSVDNLGSMRLFKNHFGFVERARQEVFHQVELVPPPDLFSRVALTTPGKKFKPDDLLAATSTLIVNSLGQTSKEFRGVDWIYHEKDVNKWRKGLI